MSPSAKWIPKLVSAAQTSGSTAVELALTLPLLLSLVLGAGDFGRIVYRTVVIANAAAAGAMYGSATLPNSVDYAGMKQKAKDDAADVGTITVDATSYCQCSNGSNVSCTSGTCTGPKKMYVKVTASSTFKTLVNYPGIPSQTLITKTAIMRAK